MKSLLDQSRYARAKPGLKFALDRLNEAARALPSLSEAVPEPGTTIENGMKVVKGPRFDPLLNPGTKEEIDAYTREYVQAHVARKRANWVADMTSYIRGTYPKASPTDGAVQDVDVWLARAIDCDYPVQDIKIRQLLCGFILAERTEGFYGEDTTGTQMGNFRGHWRGGGFAE